MTSFSVYFNSESCTTPGYSGDPLFGCYRCVKVNPPVTMADAIKSCASDGGSLLLIDSAAEAKAFAALLVCY